ncbi:MAG: thioredoxin domain-containing protein [Bacteroidota bacterium]
MRIRNPRSFVLAGVCILLLVTSRGGWSAVALQLSTLGQVKSVPNDLRNERSPYLLSAAHQPVNWLPWGDEAFRRAKSEDKPILLDIGAVWCHWCHVMDSESYENSEVAKVINENFIPIKVDRDERPDIDARLQTAVSAISGQGGWPLTAMLTPDGKVFYGGTYFPPDDRYGRPGLKRVLQTLAEKYRTERGKILESVEELYVNLKKSSESSLNGTGLSETIVDSALSSISNAFDIRNGGFGSSPKFPHASAIEFLLWRYSLTGEKWMLTIVDSTLKAMAKGGVYDQLAGGFHRYSTDERWIVPHFEKMLYDNAELLKNYVHAYQAMGDESFKETALSLISFVNTVLSDQENGGFYASQDADIGMKDDGDYFTWTNEEARNVLTPDELEVISMHYHLDGAGEMHTSDRHVLYVAKDAGEIADSLKKAESEVKSLLHSAKEKLLKARLQRRTPFVDPTVYANWNGMMVSAYLEAYKAFNQKSYLEFALKTLDRIISEGVSPTFDVAHSVGQATKSSYLEDQVQVASALLDAYEVTGADKYLSLAEKIMRRTIERYWDKEAGGFLDVPQEDTTLAVFELPNKPIQDSPSSGANAVAIFALIRLNQFTGEDSYRTTAERALKHFVPVCKDYGIFGATFFHALDVFLNPPPHVVVIGDKNDPRTLELHEVALRTHRPNVIVQSYDPKESSTVKLPSVVASMITDAGRPVAYVCTSFVCAPPAYDVATLARTLKSFGTRSTLKADN